MVEWDFVCMYVCMYICVCTAVFLTVCHPDQRQDGWMDGGRDIMQPVVAS